MNVRLYSRRNKPEQRICAGRNANCILIVKRRHDMRLTRYKFRLGLGLLFATLGVAFVAASIHEFTGPRPHGLLRFYEFIAVGPLLLLAGVGCCLDKNAA